MRVFVTGLSALTACGNTADSTWDAILAGRSGIEEIKHWDLSSWEHRLGGELKHFHPASLLPDRKLMKMISRHDAMGINAAIQAVNHSQLINYRDTLTDSSNYNEQTAIYVGSPGNKYYQQDDFLPLLAQTQGDLPQFAEQLSQVVHPMWLLRILPNNVLAYTGIIYGFKGANHNITNHAVGGMQAIIEGYHAIKQGKASRVIVVAYDVATEPQALYYYAGLGLISKNALKPFDIKHDGTILAEGAAAVVLESETSVKERAAVCYAEIIDGLSSTEAAGLFSIQADGAELASLITQVLANNQLTPTTLDFIVAHGNGNIKSDDSEASAFHRVGPKVPITAFKWATGHTICPAGLLDTVLAIYALKHKCIPGIANFSQPAANCQNLNLSRQHRDINGRGQGLVISRGFASMNACLLLRACE